MIASKIKPIKEGTDRLRREIQINVTTAVLAAFGFMIALVWRDAIQEAINKLLVVLDLTGDAYIFKVISAAMVTFVSVIGIIYFSKFKEEDKK